MKNSVKQSKINYSIKIETCVCVPASWILAPKFNDNKNWTTLCSFYFEYLGIFFLEFGFLDSGSRSQNRRSPPLIETKCTESTYFQFATRTADCENHWKWTLSLSQPSHINVPTYSNPCECSPNIMSSLNLEFISSLVLLRRYRQHIHPATAIDREPRPRFKFLRVLPHGFLCALVAQAGES